MKNSKITIAEVFDKFLKEQQVRLKPRTYSGYEDAISFFEDYMDGYAYQYLGENDSKLFDESNKEEETEFCEIFGPDHIGSTHISRFLRYFMVQKVIGSRELMKTVGRVMRKFVAWMYERGYMDEEEFEYSSEVVDHLKDQLPEVEELSCLLFEYIQDHPIDHYSETVEGYFEVTKIKPGELWAEEMLTDKKVGPIKVSRKISSLCRVGWRIYLELGKTRKTWRLLASGSVTPR